MSILLLFLFSYAFACSTENEDLQKLTQEDYDFIIVGAGSAGSVLANRLTEISTVKVLLLEAGYDEIEENHIPLMAGALKHGRSDWKYYTESLNNSCLAFENQQCVWSSGKVLGGSSSINFMAYVRGNRRDYDEWAKLGNEEWDFDSLLPYFIKLENYVENSTLEDGSFRSKSGPLMVSYPPYKTALVDAFLSAGKKLGYEIRDYNGKYQTGVSKIQASIGRGKRCSTNTAYLQPIKDKRTNLKILTEATVLRILLDHENRAHGVQFVKDGHSFIANASKEVILSAGALNSPQILMLSGIGPKKELDKFKIPIKVELEGVGNNLQDHLAAGGLEWIIDQPITFTTSRVKTKANYDAWLNYGKGPLTVPGGVEATAFVHTVSSDPTLDYPDIQLFYLSGSPASDGGANSKKSYGFTNETWDGYYEPIKFKEVFTIFPVILRPKSRGRISLNSANPLDPPKLDPGFYTDLEDHDIKTMVQGMRIALQFGNSCAFSPYNARFHNITFPGCGHFKHLSDEYLACLARHYVAVNFHPSCTCAMGKIEENPMAVVDPLLRVHNVKRLRVIDASVMPLIISGNLNAPTIMIAEKAADIIKNYWKLT